MKHLKEENKIQRTSIEWVFNPDGSRPGWACNPIKGYCSIACPYCYARRIYDHFKWDKTIRFDVDELLSIEHHRKPAGIFLGSTFELFWDGLERFWQDSIFATIKACPQHRFYLLTKCPQNLIKFSPFPDNVYLGVTVTNQEMLDMAIYYLKMVKTKVKFISFEPLLESVAGPRLNLSGINWVIIGAMTGNLEDIKKMLMIYPQLTPMPWGKKWTLQPRIEWVKEIVESADREGIAVFLKNNLLPLFEGITKGEDWTGIRQEMPDAK